MDRKKIILFLFLGIFAVTLVYRILNPYEQARVTDHRKRTQISHHKGPAKGDKRSAIDIVMVDALLKPPRHSGEVSRDIFSEKKEVVAKSPPQEAVAARKAEQAALPAAEDPRAIVSRDLSGLRVFGAYKRGRESGLFIERGKEILVIHEGDRIDGKYLVKEITENGVTLRAEAINEDVHIDLSDF